jgi:hypothetical protein
MRRWPQAPYYVIASAESAHLLTACLWAIHIFVVGTDGAVMQPIDVSRVAAEARPVVQQAAAVYLRHTQPWFVGLLIHGSALKGGFIAGCSDVDLQLYLDASAFTSDGQLPLDLCLAIYPDLATVDPAPFRYLQPEPCGPFLLWLRM